MYNRLIWCTFIRSQAKPQKLISVIPFFKQKKRLRKVLRKQTLHFSTIPFSLKYLYHQNYTRNLLFLGIELALWCTFIDPKLNPNIHPCNTLLLTIVFI